MSSSMIDPNILLQSRPAQVETPMAAATQAQSLQNLATQNQIQHGSIDLQAQDVAAKELENQQRTIALANQQATNAAIAQNVKQGADGKPYIDHSGVVQTLTQAGKGQAALQYQQNATAIQEGVAKLNEANQKLATAHTQNVGALAGSILDAPAAARPMLYPLAIHSAIQNHQIQPGEFPDQYDPKMDAQLQQMRENGQSAEQQVQSKQAAASAATAQQNAEANQQRADAAEKRAEAYQDLVTNKGQGQWKDTGETRNGHAVYFNATTGEEMVGGAIDASSTAGGRAGRGDGLTAGQQAIQDRADAKAQADARDRMDEIHQERTRLGGALAVQNGSNYIDPKSGKMSTQAMNDATRTEFEQEYRNVTNEGRRIGKQYGWSEFGPAPAAPAASPAPAPAAPKPAAAAPKPSAAPTYSRYATNGKVRIGLNTATNQWEPVAK